MKNIIFSIALFLFVGGVASAQISTEEMLRPDSPSVSLSTIGKPNDKASFLRLFETWNVGNLHFYSQRKANNNIDYHFKGKEIDPVFIQYLPISIQKAIVKENKKQYAVAVVRGAALSNLFIMRVHVNKNENTLILFDEKGDQLDELKTLAFFRKKGKKFKQLDSWMKDLNGDTRLDLIQKNRTLDADGTIKKQRTKIFIKTRKGKFKRTRKFEIEDSDYKMQSFF